MSELDDKIALQSATFEVALLRDRIKLLRETARESDKLRKMLQTEVKALRAFRDVVSASYGRDFTAVAGIKWLLELPMTDPEALLFKNTVLAVNRGAKSSKIDEKVDLLDLKNEVTSSKHCRS